MVATLDTLSYTFTPNTPYISASFMLEIAVNFVCLVYFGFNVSGGRRNFEICNLVIRN